VGFLVSTLASVTVEIAAAAWNTGHRARTRSVVQFPAPRFSDGVGEGKTDWSIGEPRRDRGGGLPIKRAADLKGETAAAGPRARGIDGPVQPWRLPSAGQDAGNPANAAVAGPFPIYL